MTETKEREFVQDRELFIKNVTLSKFGNDIKKVTFEVENLNGEGEDIKVTYKPVNVLKQTSDVGGVECVEDIKKAITVQEAEKKLEKVFLIKQVINNKQKCKVKMSYQVWNTENDGQPATYRYLQKKHFEELEVLDSPQATEEQVQ